jgi:hypothetical protein
MIGIGGYKSATASSMSYSMGTGNTTTLLGHELGGTGGRDRFRNGLWVQKFDPVGGGIHSYEIAEMRRGGALKMTLVKPASK